MTQRIQCTNAMMNTMMTNGKFCLCLKIEMINYSVNLC